MKSLKKILLACVAFGFAQVVAAASPVTGYWKTIDDVTGDPKAIVQMTESASHVIQGTIIKIFPRPGFDQNELCTACKGGLHNQRIVGMRIVNGLTEDKDTPGLWNGGDILDPHNGKTYHCTVQLGDNNNRLNVRGYIGMPLFGRTQTWVRVRNANG
jgi:uncharacterized protein (DUF2147 family)